MRISCQLIHAGKYRDKKDIKDNMPAPYETQGLQVFSILGQNRDENGHKYSPGTSAAGQKRSAMPYGTAPLLFSRLARLVLPLYLQDRLSGHPLWPATSSADFLSFQGTYLPAAVLSTVIFCFLGLRMIIYF